jgi:zinc protease
MAGTSNYWRHLALALLACGGLGQIPPVSAAPGGTAQVLRRTLPNGLTVMAEARRTAPVVTVMMWYRVGSRDEVPGETGVAHFVEHLMFKGTGRLAKGEIDRLTMQAGGSNNAFTGPDYTAYVFNLPADQWRLALRIEADRMRNSRFAPGEFEAERQVVIEERRGGEDDPGERLHEQTNGVAFLAHPYRSPVIGWMSDLTRLTREQVVQFYRRYYVPANATCVVVGDVNPAAVLQEARRVFATVPQLAAVTRPQPEEPPQTGERRTTVRADAQAPRLQVQFHTPRRDHPHQAPLEVVAQALSGGKSSRLYRRLVDGEQLATEVSADVADALDPDATRFVVTLKPGASLEKAEAALLDELRRLTRAPLSADEVSKARNQLETAFLEEQDTAQERATLLGEASSLTGLAYLDRYLPRLAAVTPAQTRRVASLYFGDTNRTIGWLVPRGMSAGKATDMAQHGAGEPRFGREADSGGGRPPGETRRGTEVTTEDTERPRSFLMETTEVTEEAQHGVTTRYPVSDGDRPFTSVRVPSVSSVVRLPSLSVSPCLRVDPSRPVRPHLAGRRVRPLVASSRRPAARSVRFRPLPAVRRVLPNGLTLLLLENHTSPLFTAAALVRAGSRDEGEAKAGLSHFVSATLDAGTVGRTDLEIARALESLGVDLDASASSSVSSLRVAGLARAMRPALAVWADVLRRPTFPAEPTAAERDRIIADIRSTADDPLLLAAHSFRDLVYGQHPAHRPVEGYERTVAGLNRDDLAAFHRAHYVPNRTTVVLVGDFRVSEAFQLLQRLLGDWKQGAAATVPPAVPKRQEGRREKRVVLPREQTQVLLGHLGVTRRNPDFVALEVLDTILGTGAGGTFTARIPQQLRDVEGLAYTVTASITESSGDDPGVFAASMGVHPRNVSRAVEGLLRELRRIRSQPVSRQELTDAVQYLIGSYVFDFETNDQLAAYLLDVEHFRLGIDYRMRYPALVRAVTAADLLRVARRYLDPQHYSLVVVGPGGAKGKVAARGRPKD